VEERSLHVAVHFEGDGYWAEVEEWPGCFATGTTLEELTEALEEAVGLYVTPTDHKLEPLDLRVREWSSRSDPRGRLCQHGTARTSLTPARRATEIHTPTGHCAAFIGEATREKLELGRGSS
jgi:predicted RNase H-like HicB family nuclease